MARSASLAPSRLSMQKTTGIAAFARRTAYRKAMKSMKVAVLLIVSLILRVAVAVAPATTQASRSPQAVVDEINATNTHLTAVWTSPDVLIDPAKRAEIAPKA